MNELEQTLIGDSAAAPPAHILEGMQSDLAHRVIEGAPHTIYCTYRGGTGGFIGAHVFAPDTLTGRRKSLPPWVMYSQFASWPAKVRLEMAPNSAVGSGGFNIWLTRPFASQIWIPNGVAK